MMLNVLCFFFNEWVMELSRGLAPTVGLTGDCNCTRIMKNGAKAGVRWGRVCRVGGEVDVGGVEVADIGAGAVKAEELDGPLAWGAYP
jgi:hypothetical protein